MPALICYICTEATLVGDSHHRDPQAYGGSDFDRADLCPNCHKLIHAAAYKLLKSPEQADSMVAFKFIPNSPAYKRCMDLVARIARKSQNPDPVSVKRVSLNLPTTAIAKLKIQAKQSGVGWLEYTEQVLIAQANKTKF